ncbi:MAG: asparagine synthase (glutamine-hydrolyzing) [Anaerolineae bacterium]|nr:asparagine synthase (glutamine-hydrolyzing) [Anaerolineae bacterium]
MCGITGIANRKHEAIDSSELQRMCATLQHRGPDEDGFFTDNGIGLAMRRLSIVDLATGQQPMTNEDGTVWVIFNGEIYNHRPIRHTLQQQGHIFRTQSDTEVIIHAYEAYGEACVEQFNGMFAFAIWDSSQRKLFLARDRLGIKPLYYWSDSDQLVFGSELKAILAHHAPPRTLCPNAIDHFLTLEYIPAPLTIFETIYKLPAGHTLTFDEHGVKVKRYWDVRFDDKPAQSEDEAVAILRDLLQDAVQMRLMSDVPLGALLSGGIDSSTIVQAMSTTMTEPVKTFSIGFGDPTYNELPYARLAATAFHTEHREAYLEPDIVDLAQRLICHLDEPLGDFSIMPTFLVSQIARQHVTVALAGDGGDELFAGYDTYVAQAVARRYERAVPSVIRERLVPELAARFKPQAAKKGLTNKAKRFVEGAALPPSLQHTRWMMFLTSADRRALYRPNFAATITNTPEETIAGHFARAGQRDPLTRQQYVDVNTYLVDNILTKVDRMSMATSLEVRVPFLDHRIVEFALNLPPHFKLRPGQTKWLLRRAMTGYLPQPIIDKPKEGFSIPMKHWLRSTLKPLLLDTLSAETITRRGLFNPTTINHWIDAHLAGSANHSHRLWALMVLELWQQANLD